MRNRPSRYQNQHKKIRSYTSCVYYNIFLEKTLQLYQIVLLHSHHFKNSFQAIVLTSACHFPDRQLHTQIRFD